MAEIKNAEQMLNKWLLFHEGFSQIFVSCSMLEMNRIKINSESVAATGFSQQSHSIAMMVCQHAGQAVF
ncbi:MAG: hypothetical protein JJU35_14485 [Balneolales bacterium]|nr:hypothetical protein [Balneolales bacterium]